ncbi:hypothetical protein F2P81_006123 [Scophthalmus maximus]|uniref:Uncharacterized protein n=1 Tax=Scophthalmus maximus TaxID=52904 RepID=A0A6A4TIA8_SCOMX|nr:hypothetical protein F2P81_006123 [Scophthalmus maximus]
MDRTTSTSVKVEDAETPLTSPHPTFGHVVPHPAWTSGVLQRTPLLNRLVRTFALCGWKVSFAELRLSDLIFMFALKDKLGLDANQTKRFGHRRTESAEESRPQRRSEVDSRSSERGPFRQGPRCYLPRCSTLVHTTTTTEYDLASDGGFTGEGVDSGTLVRKSYAGDSGEANLFSASRIQHRVKGIAFNNLPETPNTQRREKHLGLEELKKLDFLLQQHDKDLAEEINYPLQHNIAVIMGLCESGRRWLRELTYSSHPLLCEGIQQIAFKVGLYGLKCKNAKQKPEQAIKGPSPKLLLVAKLQTDAATVATSGD